MKMDLFKKSGFLTVATVWCLSSISSAFPVESAEQSGIAPEALPFYCENRNNGRGPGTTHHPLTQQEPLKAFPLIADTASIIITMLPIPEILKLEQVCRLFRDASGPIYTGLIRDFQTSNGLQEGKKPRIIFQKLLQNPEFQVHLADLWRNYFPLILPSASKNPPCIHYYWESYIGLGTGLGEIALKKINSFYSRYIYSRYINSFYSHYGSSCQYQAEAEYKQRAEIGMLLIEEREIPGSQRSLEKSRLIEILLEKLIPKESKSLVLPLSRHELLVKLARLRRKEFGGVEARTSLNKVLEDATACRSIRAEAQYYILEADLIDLSVELNDAVLNALTIDSHFSPPLKALFHLQRATIARDGFGMPCPDYRSAWEHYAKAMRHPALSPVDRARVAFEMGQIAQDFKESQFYFQMVLDNPAALRAHRERAQYYLKKTVLKGSPKAKAPKIKTLSKREQGALKAYCDRQAKARAKRAAVNTRQLQKITY